MSLGAKTIIYPVRDLAAAKQRFQTLFGQAPSTDSPYYVGFTVDGQDIGLDPNGHAQGSTGPVPYFHVSDIRAALAGLRSDAEVRDVGNGRLIAVAKDPDGNPIGLLQDS